MPKEFWVSFDYDLSGTTIEGQSGAMLEDAVLRRLEWHLASQPQPIIIKHIYFEKLTDTRRRLTVVYV